MHPGFDARVFASRELESIERASDSNRQRWRLWSAKEAAYKMLRKLDASVAFSPVKFSVDLDSQGSGWVRFSSWRVPVRVAETTDAIHALAFEDDRSSAGLTHGLLRMTEPCPDPSSLSRAARQLAITQIAKEFGFDSTELEIRRESRIPYLMRAGQRAGLDLSLSHHGQCVGFACTPSVLAEAKEALPIFEAADSLA